MKGIGRIYDHVTEIMRQQISYVLEARWVASLVALTATERRQLVKWFPHLEPVMADLKIGYQGRENVLDAILAPSEH